MLERPTRPRAAPVVACGARKSRASPGCRRCAGQPCGFARFAHWPCPARQPRGRGPSRSLRALDRAQRLPSGVPAPDLSQCARPPAAPQGGVPRPGCAWAFQSPATALHSCDQCRRLCWRFPCVRSPVCAPDPPCLCRACLSRGLRRNGTVNRSMVIVIECCVEFLKILAFL